MGIEGILKQAGVDSAELQRRPRKHAADYYAVKVPRARMAETWLALRAYGAQDGYYPILQPWGDYIRDEEYFQDRVPEQIVAAGLRLNISQWLAERAAQDPEYFAEESIRGEWPDEVAGARPFATESLYEWNSRHLGSKDNGKVLMFLLPVRHPWEVMAYLVLGGCNECPDAEHQVAMMKRWHEQYGAEIAVDGNDYYEMRVERPPQDRESALTLAREQFIYCPDIVHQGTGTLDDLAAGLMGSQIWFFWWD